MEVADYKRLLKLYMAKVIDCEGIDFLDTWSPQIVIEEDEMCVLEELASDARREYAL